MFVFYNINKIFLPSSFNPTLLGLISVWFDLIWFEILDRNITKPNKKSYVIVSLDYIKYKNHDIKN